MSARLLPALALLCVALPLACSSTPTPQAPDAAVGEAPVVAAPGTAEAPAPPGTSDAAPALGASLVGSYALAFEPDASWHQHRLEIGAVEAEVITGVVEIDQGIGPEGRAPNPDEIMHRVHFRAARAGTPQRLRFMVSVGDFSPTLYTFDLGMCPESGCAGDASARLQGTVTVASGASSQTLQATARRP